jgi:Family of unknown function (DUF6463)
MKIWIGKSLIIIGIIHSMFGFIIYQDLIVELAKEMLFNTIGRQPERLAAFWFFFTGCTLMVIGGLINWAELKQLELPPFVKWSLLSLTLIGCFFMPTSGLWLMLVPSVGLLLRKNSSVGV